MRVLEVDRLDFLLILGGGKDFSRFGKDLGTGLATASFSAPLGPASQYT